jgi:hypothetical protein
MKLQAFIFNWPGKKQHAAKLEALFRPHCETTVINSDDNLRAAHPHWQHIGNDAFFTAQWNAALDRFNGDIFVHIQADVWPVSVGEVLAESVRFIRDRNVGVYAPDVDFNAHFYRTRELSKIAEGVYEVPRTDCSFWAISAEVLRDTPRVDPRVNRLGWGIEEVVGAVARRKGLKLVRDYRFTAGHEKGSGYNLEKAWDEWQLLRGELEPELRDEMDAMEAERHRLRIPETPRKGMDGLFGAVRRRAFRDALIWRRRVAASYELALQNSPERPSAAGGPLTPIKRRSYGEVVTEGAAAKSSRQSTVEDQVTVTRR